MNKYTKFEQLYQTTQYTLYSDTQINSLILRLNVNIPKNTITVYQCQLNTSMLGYIGNINNCKYSFLECSQYLRNGDNFRVQLENQEIVINGMNGMQCVRLELNKKYIVENGMLIYTNHQNGTKIIKTNQNLYKVPTQYTVSTQRQQLLSQAFRLQLKGIRRLLQLQKLQHNKTIQSLKQKHQTQLQIQSNKFTNQLHRLQAKIQKISNKDSQNHMKQDKWSNKSIILIILIFCLVFMSYSVNSASSRQYDNIMDIVSWAKVNYKLVQVQQRLSHIQNNQSQYQLKQSISDKLLTAPQTHKFIQILQNLNNKLPLQYNLQQSNQNQISQQQIQHINNILIKIPQLQHQINKLKQINIVTSIYAKDWVDEQSIYYDDFAVINSTVVAIHSDSFSYLYSKVKLVKGQKSIFTINMTEGTPGVGIIDVKLIDKRRYLNKQNSNSFIYFSNGDCYDGQKWNTNQGTMFEQGDQVTVQVDREYGQIIWKVGTQIRYSVINNKINDESIVWVPFLIVYQDNVINII